MPLTGIDQETYNTKYASKTAAALANITGVPVKQIVYNSTTVLNMPPPEEKVAEPAAEPAVKPAAAAAAVAKEAAPAAKPAAAEPEDPGVCECSSDQHSLLSGSLCLLVCLRQLA
jgi:hypothetical protein